MYKTFLTIVALGVFLQLSFSQIIDNNVTFGYKPAQNRKIDVIILDIQYYYQPTKQYFD